MRTERKSNMAEYSDGVRVFVDGEDLEGLFHAATEFVRTLKDISDEQKLTFYALYKQGSDNAVLSVLTLDPKENERPAKKIKAEKAKDVEEVKLDLYKEAIKCLQTPLALAIGQPNVENHVCMLFMEYQTLCYKNKQKEFPNLKCSDLFRDSWKKLGKMPQQKAVEHYIQELCDLDPEWEEKYAVTDDLTVKETEKSVHMQTMGIAVSTLRGQDAHEDEFISDDKKSVFDWCKEGNVKKLDALLIQGDSVNAEDDQGMTLLHWACDRGHEDVVRYLIKNKAKVNAQDADGQTPLHYAATCDFLSIVQELLKSGADCSIADIDSCQPSDVADSPTVKELLETRNQES